MMRCSFKMGADWVEMLYGSAGGMRGYRDGGEHRDG
jgi:hypothetical protein